MIKENKNDDQNKRKKNFLAVSILFGIAQEVILELVRKVLVRSDLDNKIRSTFSYVDLGWMNNIFDKKVEEWDITLWYELIKRKFRSHKCFPAIKIILNKRNNCYGHMKFGEMDNENYNNCYYQLLTAVNNLIQICENEGVNCNIYKKKINNINDIKVLNNEDLEKKISIERKKWIDIVDIVYKSLIQIINDYEKQEIIVKQILEKLSKMEKLDENLKIQIIELTNNFSNFQDQTVQIRKDTAFLGLYAMWCLLFIEKSTKHIDILNKCKMHLGQIYHIFSNFLNIKHPSFIVGEDLFCYYCQFFPNISEQVFFWEKKRKFSAPSDRKIMVNELREKFEILQKNGISLPIDCFNFLFNFWENDDPEDENTVSSNSPSAGNQNTVSNNSPSGGNTAIINNTSGGTTASINNSSGGTTTSINNPSGGTTTSINNPSGGTTTSINSPSGGPTTSINNPSGGTTASINNPSGGTTTSINNPSGGTTASINSPSPVNENTVSSNPGNESTESQGTQSPKTLGRGRGRGKGKGRGRGKKK